MLFNKIIKISELNFFIFIGLAKEYYKIIIICYKDKIKMPILIIADKILDLKRTIGKINTTINWNLDNRIEIIKLLN